MPTLIETMEARSVEIETEIDSILSEAEKREKPEVTDEDQTKIDALTEEHRSVKTKIDTAKAAAQIKEDRAKAAPASVVTPVMPVANDDRDEVYRSTGRESYFRDSADAKLGKRDAVERLVQNDKRNKALLETRTGTTTVAGAGGEFAPPLWLVDEFVALARPGRPFANLVNNIPLPPDVASISLPKITTGTTTTAQGTQNTAIGNQDIVTTSVSTNITTQAGGVIVSRQILDQSPISMDQVITADLARDIAQKIDLALLTAVAAVSGLNSVTYTDASPTTAKLLPYVQQAIDQVGLGIYTPNALVSIMRTDRWGRFAAAVDSTGRPLLALDGSYGPWNAKGIQTDAISGQGPAGSLQGIAGMRDAQVPNNLGGGTNQDEIFVLDPTQIWLYESAVQTDAFEQTYANTLSVYCRAFEYYGIIANRLPKAISLITGTGLIPYTYGS